jgi:hypothetical protein
MDKKVGRFEKIYFPELNLKVDSKIDTGAYSVSLHVEDITEIDGKLHFWVGEKSNKFIYDDFNIINVKSSFGKKQKRYSINLKMVMGDFYFNALVSLTDRKKMKFPCLIGRRFLYKHGFLVDVRKKNLHDRNKKM